MQGVEVLHNLTADKLLTVKLKETKKALDGMCTKLMLIHLPVARCTGYKYTAKWVAA